MNKPLRVAVVGSGPAGMYSIGHLLETPGLDVEIDLYERLPTPWGLVRNGVAPDHPEKKLVADRLFSYYLHRPQVRFIGNVEVGNHVRHAELADWYSAVIYATGANGDIQMGIPGEELPGSWSAREFVAWYNGHPDFAHLRFNLSGERAVIVGTGNVALDVARILTLSTDDLARTDIADYALATLRDNPIREVVILGRRGHLQGAFNNPELEELGQLTDVGVTVDGEDFPAGNEIVLDGADWETQRKVQTLARLVNRRIDNARKRIIFRFLSSPVEIIGDREVEQVLVARNHLEHDDNGRLRARPTGEEYLLDTRLIFRSIGYRGNPFPGLPFDDHRGVIENHKGRVCYRSEPVAGVYVTGWIKRGPKGIIGTNKQCSGETVAALLEDHRAGKLNVPSVSRDQVLSTLGERQANLFHREQWQKVDLAELAAGRKKGRPRVKLTAVDKMVDTALAD